MLIKVTVEGGVVQDIETSEPAVVQIVNGDGQPLSTFNTVAQAVRLEYDPEEPELTEMPPPLPEAPVIP